MGLVGLYLAQGKIEAAEREARRGLELAEDLGDPGWVGMAHCNKAYVDRLAGDLEGALVEIDLACPDPAKASIYDLGALYLRALATLEMGRTDEFEARLKDIRDLVTRERYPKLMRAYHLLLGQRELRAGSAEKAVDHLWRAVKLLPSPMGKSNADADSARYYSALAEAYLRAGAYALAAEMYAKVPSYWEQRFNSGDVYARAFYGRARAQELLSEDAGLTAERRKAERAKAAEGYSKFLSLWGKADPIFAAEVADARKRLALLEAE
jgi:tetratricopeptide (TPR) repeat protein